MIPKEGRDLIDTNLDMARKSEIDEHAERYLHAAESMLSFALGCGMISIQGHAGEIVAISLIRAQRRSDAESLDQARQQAAKSVKWPAPKDDGAYRFNPMSGEFEN